MVDQRHSHSHGPTRHRIGSCLWLLLLLESQACWSTDADPTWTFEGPPSLAQCPAGPEACDLWMRFRTAHPWPYQGISTGTRGDETIVILSEAPPTVSRADLTDLVRAAFGDENIVQVARLRWPTGLNGWLEDAVVRVHSGTPPAGSPSPAPPTPSPILERLPVIAHALFGTSDGFRALDLDAALANSSQCHVDEITVGPADLNRWSAEELDWHSLDTGRVAPAADIRSGADSGAYVRNDDALIAFVLSKGSKLADYRASFRRFATASDVLVGAAAPKAGGLVLLARRRTIHDDCLPPLRFETFELFVRTASRELAQSYERQRLFAGKVREGAFQGWDWAPIYLSGELDDTEFGTLLDLADQVLKSWSQHGEVAYFAFDYPQPATYPFGDVSASEYFSQKYDTSSLVFNWNTSGLGLVTSLPSKDQLLTVDRTGALPILYIPSGGPIDLASQGLRKRASRGLDLADLQAMLHDKMTEDAEKQANLARSYFASLGDPILARVVQNVTLYQAARVFIPAGNATKATRSTRSSRSDITIRTLRTEATIWLTDVSSGRNSRGLSPQTVTTIKEFLRAHQMTPAHMAEIIATPQTAVQEFAGLEARRRELYESYVAEAPAAEEAARVADAAFQKFCREVKGTITPTSDGEECKYLDKEYSSYDSERAAVNRLQAIALQKDKSVESLGAHLTAADAELNRLAEAFSAARSLGEVLQQEAQFVGTLGTVLENVQKATSADPTVGTIRTPALVMSRNNEDAAAIGGHNIDSTVTRAHVVPGAGQAHFEGIVGNRVLVLPPDQLDHASALAKRLDQPATLPQRTAAEALNVASGEPNTLLDVYRRTAARAEDTTVQKGILEAAENCDCDVLVVQDGDVFRIVRNRPSPPQVILAPSRTAVADAIAGPPLGTVVRFESVDPLSVEYVAQSVALTRESAGGSGIGNFIRSVRDVFSGKPEAGSEPLFMVWGKRRSETIRVIDETSPLGQTLTATSSTPGKSVWRFPGSKNDLATAAGLATPRPSTAGQAAIVVRFQGQAGAGTAKSLGVYAEIQGRTDAAAQSALEQAATAELPRAALSNADFYSRVSALADTLRARLTPSELHFFRASKQSGLQVTQLVDVPY
jgi:hypothetical protein